MHDGVLIYQIKLDDELTIDRTYPSEGDRISSLDLDPPEFALMKMVN